jgi:hypothetical protein
MAYRDQLYPWCIVHSVHGAQSTVVARFRRRTDAEAHLRILRQTHPSFTYRILFEKAPADQPAEPPIETQTDDI